MSVAGLMLDLVAAVVVAGFAKRLGFQVPLVLGAVVAPPAAVSVGRRLGLLDSPGRAYGES